MAAIKKDVLSESTHGRMIKVVQTATPGTLIHTAKAGIVEDEGDEVWLWAQNSDTSVRKLTIEWGGVSSPDDLIEMYIPPEAGPVLVVPGWFLRNALEIRAFASSANLIMVGGYINRVSAG